VSLHICIWYKFQTNLRGINDLFTGIGEHDGHKRVNPRLYLPDAPAGVVGVTDEHSRGEDRMAHSPMNSAADSADQTANAALDLSASLASRICHDLVSPMGAISNGLELLQLAQQPGGPELELINQSVESATTRLRFYRIALGRVSDDQKIGRAEILSILNSMEKYQKQKCQWDSEAELSRRQVKLAFLLLMCLETALPWGGRIVVRDISDGLEFLTVSDRFKINDELWSRLEEPVNFADLSSAQVHFGLACAEIRKQAAAYKMTQNTSGLIVTIGFKSAG